MRARVHASNLVTALVVLLALPFGCGDDGASSATDGGSPSVDGGRPRDAHTPPGDGGGPRDANTPPGDGGPTSGLPTGDMGIAARHPGDEGLGADPEVVFFEDFESYGSVDELWDNWFNVFGDLELVSDAPNVLAGSRSLQMTLSPSTEEQGSALLGEVSPELDTMFLRWYAKIDSRFDVVGSSHNGGGISAHYNVGFMATPGIPADGMNKFLIEYECWRGQTSEPNPGNLNVYVYHPEQRDNYGDHFFPDGIVLPNTSLPGDFGSDFVPRSNVNPDLDRWYAFEVMVQANTPGARDGRIAFWLDGNLVADFPNVRLRDIATLTIDRFGVSFHARSSPTETHKWVDNIVAARAYIGPMFTP